MPTYGMEVFDVATLTYGGSKKNVTLNMGDLGHLGILRLHPMGKVSFGHAL